MINSRFNCEYLIVYTYLMIFMKEREVTLSFSKMKSCEKCAEKETCVLATPQLSAV